MELVGYVAGEPWSDHPQCASSILTSFLIRLNDRLDDEDRQVLKPYIVRLVGTNTGLADEETRQWMLTDWLVHEALPGLLRQADLGAHADALEQLVAITDRATYDASRPARRAARDAAWAKRSAWRERIREQVRAEMAKQPAAAVAVAVAVADAAADAAAAAAAVAVAVAVADADAAADAAAAAVAVADAVAVAAAVAVAVAAAVAAAAPWNSTYDAAYKAAYEILKPAYEKALEPISAGLRQSALLLLDRLIDVGRTDEAKAA
jgi:hypothetical protein